MHDDQEPARRDWRIPDVWWARIAPLLPARKPHPLGCHRPRVADRQAMDAILVVLRTGCQWQALHETKICARSSAHRRFPAWGEAEVCVALWAQGLVEYEALPGIDWEGLALEGAMTQAPLGGEKVGKHPTERGKIGPQRRVLTDGQGVPLGLAVDGANRHDGKLTRETIESMAVERPDATPDAPQGLCLDKGYDDDEVRALLDACGFTAHIRARGEAAQALKQEAGFKARRWVVERTPSWMNRFRRVRIRWDKKVCNYLGFLHLACAYITYHQAGLLR